MKRKITLILSFVVLAFTINAQVNKNIDIFYLSESFETGIPDTWTIETTGDISWEHRFDYAIANSTGYPGSHVAGILTSPVVDVSSASALNLVFNHYFYFMGLGETGLIEVYDGTAWVTVWNTEDQDFPTFYGEQVISVTDYINDAFQVRFTYDDLSNWVLYWKLFDVSIVEQEMEDLAVVSISPSTALPGDTVIPQVLVRNYGWLDINFTYNLLVTIAGTDYNVDLDDAYIGQLGTGAILVDCPEWIVPTEVGDYDITATINYSFDTDPSNNTKVLTCSVMNYPDASVGNNNGKFYSVNLDNGDLTEYGGFESIPYSMADEFAEGKLYRMTEWLDFNEVALDGKLTLIDEANFYDQWTALGYAPFDYAMAYDWSTKRMYIAGDDGSSWPVGNPHLAYFDLETYELVYVGQINTGGMIVGMDFADDGFLYGVGVDGNLYKITVDPFEVEVVGTSFQDGLNKDFNDLSYDRGSHTMYGMIRYNWISQFGSFNLETGAFTVIQTDYDPNSNYICLAITKDPVALYTLTFTVNDGTNPIEGAEIDINGETMTTNGSGTASILLGNGDFDYTVTYSGYYDYTGTVTIQDGTQEVSITMEEITTGIDEVSNDFNIFPNPSNGKYKISSKSNFTFEVYNTNGIKIYSDEVERTESTIDIVKEAKGIYFLKIRTKSDSKIIKLIKN